MTAMTSTSAILTFILFLDYKIIMKLLVCISFLSSVASWTNPSLTFKQSTQLFSGDFLEDEDSFQWQDIYKGAPMSYSSDAMFIAADWIKSMPCAENIEVRSTLCYIV